MKKVLFLLMVTLMSVVASTPAYAKSGTSDWKSNLPTNIIVKQTTFFDDGRSLTLYYKKTGTLCEVYSPCKESDYTLNDASKITSTNFEVANKVEGKLYRKATLGEVVRILRQALNQFL